MNDRIPVAPFIDWCNQREQMIRRELDAHPAITAGRHGGGPVTVPQHANPRARLVMELGWDHDNGLRRLHRWEHEGDGHADRNAIEDALHHAGVAIDDVYPDLPEPEALDDEHDRYCPKCRYVVSSLRGQCPWCKTAVSQTRVYRTSRVGMNSKMTDQQIRAAHTLYTSGMTLQQVGALIWQRYGYSSVHSCSGGLRRAWRIRGLPQRDRGEVSRATHTTHGLTVGRTASPAYNALVTARKRATLGACQHIKRDGTVCGLTNREGYDTCGYHQPDMLAWRRELILSVRADGTAAAVAARAARREQAAA